METSHRIPNATGLRATDIKISVAPPSPDQGASGLWRPFSIQTMRIWNREAEGSPAALRHAGICHAGRRSGNPAP